MSKNLPFIIILLIVIVCVGSYNYYKNNYLSKYEWYENYGSTNEEPYGVKLLYTAIKENGQTISTITSRDFKELDTNATNINFVSLSQYCSFDSVLTARLLDFCKKGNRVFIAANNSPYSIIRRFVPSGKNILFNRSIRDSSVRIRFAGADEDGKHEFKFHFQFYKRPIKYQWLCYDLSAFNSYLAPHGFKPLSYMNDSTVNSFIIEHGKGKIIIHANPIVFTNYHFSTVKGFDHANKYLAQLHDGPTYWYDGESDDYEDYSDAPKNPLKLLFSHPYLKWGWYLFLGNVVLYLLFRSKREQRIIPLLPVNTNASIEYTKAIGTLYFRTNRHDHLVNELNSIFLAEIRNRYGIRTDLPQAQLIEQVSQRSGVDAAQVKHLFTQFKLLRDRPDVELSELTNLYHHVEEFNKKRK